jgi:hypothetical protein
MRFLSPRHLVRLGIGAIVLLSLQGVLAPRSARAGCDHPFGVEIRNAWSAAYLDPLITGDPRSSLEGNLPGGFPGRPGPGRPLPCSGPSCSGRVPLPASTAPSVVRTLDQWGLLPGPFDLASPVAKSCRDEETRSHLPVEPTRIFHPPRPMA